MVLSPRNWPGPITCVLSPLDEHPKLHYRRIHLVRRVGSGCEHDRALDDGVYDPARCACALRRTWAWVGQLVAGFSCGGDGAPALGILFQGRKAARLECEEDTEFVMGKAIFHAQYSISRIFRGNGASVIALLGKMVA